MKHFWIGLEKVTNFWLENSNSNIFALKISSFYIIWAYISDTMVPQSSNFCFFCFDKKEWLILIFMFSSLAYVLHCTIWYDLYNLKNMKNTDGGFWLLTCNFTKSSTTPWVFFMFFLIVQMVPNRATHLISFCTLHINHFVRNIQNL